MRFDYVLQPSPDGLAEAFTIGADFIGKDSVALALGDNVFHRQSSSDQLQAAREQENGARVFAYLVRDPQRFGVIEFAADGRPVDVIEKPRAPRSPYALTGLYFFDNDVVDITREVRPSARGVLLWFSSSGQGYGRRGGFGVEGPVAEHGVEYIGSSSGQRDHSLVVAFALRSFSIVVGPRSGLAFMEANAERNNARFRTLLPRRDGDSPRIEVPDLLVTGAIPA